MSAELFRFPFVAVIAALVLGGCAAVQHEQVAHDSRRPDAGLPACTSAGSNLVTECLTLVRADELWSDTGIRAKDGETYLITVPKGQTWLDAGRVNLAPLGEQGSGWMNLAAVSKRQDAAWFSLIAAVAAEGRGLDRQELDWVDIGGIDTMAGTGTGGDRRRKEQATCDGVAFTVKVKDDDGKGNARVDEGMLTLYPNDARGPESHPTYFYENNSGQVWVKVKKLSKEEVAQRSANAELSACTRRP